MLADLLKTLLGSASGETKPYERTTNELQMLRKTEKATISLRNKLNPSTSSAIV